MYINEELYYIEDVSKLGFYDLKLLKHISRKKTVADY